MNANRNLRPIVLQSLRIGEIVEVGKAYDMETGRRTRVDEFTGCEGEVLDVIRQDAVLWIDGIGEVTIFRGRLHTRSAA